MFDGAAVSKNCASSAYIITLPCGTCCVRSFVKTRNNTGPSIDPCIRPCVTSRACDVPPFITCVRPRSQSANQSDRIPYHPSLSRRRPCSTLSNAFDVSAVTSDVTSPRSMLSVAYTPQPATLPELSAALQRMGTSRACGPDGITIKMLKTTFAVVGPHLLHIVNSCITNCDMPLQWKASVITPLYKKGDRSDPSNYRPISIIPVVAKLCERVICTQLMVYLTSHCILCPQQYGFRAGLSTEAAVLDAVANAPLHTRGGRGGSGSPVSAAARESSLAKLKLYIH